LVRGLGPGLVSGASANDPTTVGSLAVVGATTGYGLSWLVVLLLPMLAVVQAIAASVAVVSGLSLQQAIVKTYGRVAAAASATAIVAVCIFTLGADVRAGADALTLLSGLPWRYFVLPLVALMGWMLATKSYLRVERLLASFTLVFLCYAASAVLAHPDWGAVLRSIALPRIEPSPVFLTGALALLGTTLTSYVYLWESIEVAERRPKRSEANALRVDAAIGMLVAGSSFLFILIASAAISAKPGASIASVADAAAALKPLVGAWATRLFAVGLLGSSAIAIPIIAATNGYVVAQTLELPASLSLEIGKARSFYGIIFASLALAAALAFLPLGTIWLLYWSSVAAGVATPLTLALTLLVARHARTMRGTPIGFPLAAAGWGVTGLVTLAVLCLAFLK
jgi:Mn2+/Fe2+ NRAMP family transporter